MIRAKDFLDLSHTAAREYLCGCETVFDFIPKIKDTVKSLIPTLGEDFCEIAPEVFAAKDAEISHLATVTGPAIIGRGTVIRPGAYIRGSVIIGDGCVIGNSTEIKNAVIFDGVQLPHYNYVGDSILGYKVHLGAGAIISNFRLDHKNVTVKTGKEKIETGLRKFGAVVGDFCEIGCNSVICPGSIIMKNTLIYPLSCVRGTVGCELKKIDAEENL
jgi:NDP-sugar pyrophosphorylase family protein